jgi:SAM-dependent methyltransferase
MTAIAAVLKGAYRNIVPSWVRRSQLMGRLASPILTHDFIYDADYYATHVEGPAVRSAGTIANSIITDLTPGRVVDVGCGTGALLEALREGGCSVFGLEKSKEGLKYCAARNLDVAAFDLERDTVNDGRTFDVAVSMEVAEHLPKNVADRYVEIITALAPIVVFTAAPPGQPGTDHVNLQPPEYWIDKYQRRGFRYAEEMTESWRDNWKRAGDVEYYYWQNLMIFRKHEGSDSSPADRA